MEQENRNPKVYSLKNDDLSQTLKLLSQAIQKAEARLLTKNLSITERDSDGNIRKIPNSNSTETKKVIDNLKQLRSVRDEIKKTHEQSKTDTLVKDLEALRKELQDRDLKEHLSSVAGITGERPSIRKLIDFDNKVKKDKKNPFTI
jgi:hypothetical protein